MRNMVELILFLALIFLAVSILNQEAERKILENVKVFAQEQQKLFKEVFGEKK